MKYASFLLLIAVAGCTKKDLHLYKNYLKKQQQNCYAVAINSDKQNTSDYYVVKTVDEFGIVRHLKTQLWDLEGVTYVFDYDITYSSGKAVFKGSTKTLYWVLDNPPIQDDNGPYIPPEPGAPRHPVEQVDLLDTRDFEVSFDKRTGYAYVVKYADSSDPEVTLTYDRQGNLTGIGGYIVTTDKKGTILSILTPKPTEPYLYGQQLGITFTYADSNSAKNTNQYYETPYIFIHPMYSLLEVLNWGPFQPHAERTGLALLRYYEDPELAEYSIPSMWVNATYVDHVYDEKGNLVRYTFDGDLTRDYPSPFYHETARRERVVTWNCVNTDKIK